MNASRTKWIIGMAAALVCGAGVAQSDARVGVVTISGGLAERPGPFDWLTGKPAATLRSVTEALDDDSFDVMVIRLEDAALSRTQIEEIGDAMGDAQDAGTPVYVVTDRLGTGEVLLGAYADRLIAQDGTGLMIPGMYMEELYLRDALEWLGIEPSFVQVGAYKGADEAFNRSEPTAPWEENISGLLDSLYGTMRDQLMDGRGLTDGELDDALERAWLADADDGIEIGLVDEALDLNELASAMEDELGDISWTTGLGSGSGGLQFDSSNPFALFTMLSQDPSNDPSGPTIAVLHVNGPIVDGDSVEGGLFGSSSVGSRTIRRVAGELADDEMIKGVVVRIDSPGGSATASEVIWQSLRSLAEEKPVYVSIGSMAASGGYYIAVGGDRIYANPSSVVGSIGVVGGKLAMQGLYDRMNINVVGRARGPRAALFGSAPWDEADKEFVRQRMTETYELFTGRVQEGRDGIDLDLVAEGRLFTGGDAVELNMIDEVGSLDTTIEALAADLDLASYDVLDYPGPQSLEDLFEQMLPAGVSAPSTGARAMFSGASVIGETIEAMVGPAWPELRQRIDAAVMLRDAPVQLMEHRVIHIR
ncbi:MAG: S49 family peptidase [Planctomycetota bacterium]